MSAKIELYERDSADRIPRRDDEWWERARRYVVPLMEDGPATYVENARVDMAALAIDDQLLPVVVGGEEATGADVCSPFSHYVTYTLDEMAKRHPRVPRPLLEALFWPLQASLRFGAVDKVVFVNNWLISTNPAPRLSASQIEAATRLLAARYPERAILFPSVNPVLAEGYRDALVRAGYRFIRSRRVYLFDPARYDFRVSSDLRRDWKLSARMGFEPVDDLERLAAAAARLTELYRGLYLQKHSPLNSWYTPDFFRLTLQERIFTYRAIVKDGAIGAFVAWYERGGAATGALVGYDLAEDRKIGLYRQAFAILTAHAAKKGIPMNLSSGADSFKLFRGGRPVEEFDAFYVRHLPLGRRLAWKILEAATRFGAKRRVSMPAEWEAKRMPSGGELSPGKNSFDWEAHSRAAPDPRRDALWWRHCDAVNATLLDRWMADEAPERVLETDLFGESQGAGPAPSLVGRAANVLGIDIAETTVRAAHRHVPGLSPTVADVRALPFKDESFDLVVSFSTLDHFAVKDDMVRGLREIARVLRRKGVLIVTLDNPLNPVVALRNALPFGLLHRVGLVPYYVGRTLGPRRLGRELAAVGLEPVATAALMHCPRVVALHAARLFDADGCSMAARALLAILKAMEGLGALPTRFLTGYFVAVRAAKR